MIIYTHISFALLILMFLIKFNIVDFNIWGVIVCVFGAILPDIDSKESIVGKTIKPVAHLTEHRGFLHSIFFELIIALLIFFTLGHFYFIMFKIGFLSHLLLDALNHKGIKPFHPLWGLKIKGKIKTNGIGEFVILGMIITTMIIIVISEFI